MVMAKGPQSEAKGPQSEEATLFFPSRRLWMGKRWTARTSVLLLLFHRITHQRAVTSLRFFSTPGIPRILIFRGNRPMVCPPPVASWMLSCSKLSAVLQNGAMTLATPLNLSQSIVFTHLKSSRCLPPLHIVTDLYRMYFNHLTVTFTLFL